MGVQARRPVPYAGGGVREGIAAAGIADAVTAVVRPGPGTTEHPAGFDATRQTDGHTLLALPDIAAMHLAAIANRGRKMDFADLYFPRKRDPIQALPGFYRRQFPNHDPFFVVRNLASFDDAEREPEPLMIH